MIARYQTLARRIRLDIEDLERTKAAAMKHWQGFRTSPVDRDAYLNSVAFNLHSLYSGLERVLELAAIELDGGPLGRENWHVELLRRWCLTCQRRVLPYFGIARPSSWMSTASSGTWCAMSTPRAWIPAESIPW